MKRTKKQRKEQGIRTKERWAKMSKKQRKEIGQKISLAHKRNGRDIKIKLPKNWGKVNPVFTGRPPEGVTSAYALGVASADEVNDKFDQIFPSLAGKKVELIYTDKYILGMEEDKTIHFIAERNSNADTN